MASSRTHPADILFDIKKKLRFVQNMLLHVPPEKDLELSPEGAEGLYLILEDAQDDLLKASELLETA